MHALMPALGLLALASSAVAQLSDGFEAYTAGYSIDGLGGWIASGGGAGASATVSSVEAYAGGKSLLIVDHSDSQRPRAIHGFSRPITSGTISFALKEDQSDGGVPDRWSVYFGTFSLSKSATQLVLGYGAGGDGTNAFPRKVNLSDLQAYSTTGWNLFSITIDGSTGFISVTVNGQAPFPKMSNPSYAWSITRFEASTYSGNGTGDAVFFDDISVIEAQTPSAPVGVTDQR